MFSYCMFVSTCGSAFFVVGFLGRLFFAVPSFVVVVAAVASGFVGGSHCLRVFVPSNLRPARLLVLLGGLALLVCLFFCFLCFSFWGVVF